MPSSQPEPRAVVSCGSRKGSKAPAHASPGNLDTTDDSGSPGSTTTSYATQNQCARSSGTCDPTRCALDWSTMPTRIPGAANPIRFRGDDHRSRCARPGRHKVGQLPGYVLVPAPAHGGCNRA